MAVRDPELHITVVAFGSGGGYNLAEEIALAKAALLYADRVTLASPKAAMLSDVAGYLSATPAEREDILMELAGILPEGAASAPLARVYMEAIRKKKHRTGEEIISLRRLEAALAKSARNMEAKVREILELAGAPELEAALRANVLTLDSLGIDRSALAGSVDAATTGANWWAGAVIGNLADMIADVLSPESTTYPMFSEMTSGLARAMVKEGKIEGAELAPATQAGIAGRFISALEAFPEAPMDVVLDARGKLRKPLRGFRSGVTRISRELDEIGPLDPRFGRRADELYREYVAPALDELRELSEEMRLLPALRRSAPAVAKDVGRMAPLIALAMTTGAGVGELAALASGAGVDLVGRAAMRQRDVRDRRDKNEFVFLYEAERRLGS